MNGLMATTTGIYAMVFGFGSFYLYRERLRLEKIDRMIVSYLIIPVFAVITIGSACGLIGHLRTPRTLERNQAHISLNKSSLTAGSRDMKTNKNNEAE